MLRWRFSSGVVLGLAIGLPLGAIIALMAAPSRNSMDAEQVKAQMEALTRRLEAAQQDVLRPTREEVTELTRRLQEHDEAEAVLREQAKRAEELSRATQGRVDALERNARVAPPAQPVVQREAAPAPEAAQPAP